MYLNLLYSYTDRVVDEYAEASVHPQQCSAVPRIVLVRRTWRRSRATLPDEPCVRAVSKKRKAPAFTMCVANIATCVEL